MDDGSKHSACRLVLALGVRDMFPDIPGFAERWGASVFHCPYCPYCHGYEIDQKPIAIIAAGDFSMHQALLLPDWGQTTLFINGAFAPDDSQRAALAKRGVAIEAQPITALEGQADVVLADGRRMSFGGIFAAPRTEVSTDVAQQLGCAFKEGPVGSFIDVNAMMQTSIAGVFACGDAARMGGSASLAVGDGAMAGVAAHRSLVSP